MVFNSLDYFLFLPVAWLLHHLVGPRWRWLSLLAVSLVFYASLRAPHLLGVLAAVTASTYGFGLWIRRARDDRRKRRLLGCGIAANILILVAMKYVPFLAENLNALLGFLGSPHRLPGAHPLVAVGVSFYVFQAISYLIDVHLGIQDPEEHPGYFALYLAFFPKLLQGPIERARDLLPQLRQDHAFDYDGVRIGLLLFTLGLFKKVVLADRLGLYVDPVYADVHAYGGVTLWLATYAYAFQIFFDFSGYTDMALGTARLFGIRLTDNFNQPYLAVSVADFWRRWHITFSRWILDYIFKPLQMGWRNLGDRGTAAAIVVTFLASGLWHGATWGFVAWGLLHGAYLACSVFYRPYQKRLHKALGLEKTRGLRLWQMLVTFHLVCFAWIFFRSKDLSAAMCFIGKLFEFSGDPVILAYPFDTIHLAILLVAGALYAVARRLVHGGGMPGPPAWVRWPVYLLLVLAIRFGHVVDRADKPFIYMGF